VRSTPASIPEYTGGFLGELRLTPQEPQSENPIGCGKTQRTVECECFVSPSPTGSSPRWLRHQWIRRRNYPGWATERKNGVSCGSTTESTAYRDSQALDRIRPINLSSSETVPINPLVDIVESLSVETLERNYNTGIH
jgi:hypothetical protein